jgi:hypothetical protein
LRLSRLVPEQSATKGCQGLLISNALARRHVRMKLRFGMRRKCMRKGARVQRLGNRAPSQRTETLDFTARHRPDCVLRSCKPGIRTASMTRTAATTWDATPTRFYRPVESVCSTSVCLKVILWWTVTGSIAAFASRGSVYRLMTLTRTVRIPSIPGITSPRDAEAHGSVTPRLEGSSTLVTVCVGTIQMGTHSASCSPVMSQG